MVMKVTAVQTVHFKDIDCGEFFSPYPGSIYLKIDETKLSDGCSVINAIDMDGGHPAKFDDSRQVYSTESEINIIFKTESYVL